MKQSGLWNSLGTHDSLVKWWLCISSSGQAMKFDFLSQIWSWRSRSITFQNSRDLNQCTLHIWSKFGDPSLNRWRGIVRTNSKWGKFWLWSYIWPSMVKVSPHLKKNKNKKTKQKKTHKKTNNRDLNHGLLQLWSKFGDPSLNGWWVIARTSTWLLHTQTGGRTHRQTDRQTQATTIPEGQNWPRVKN